MYTPTKPIVALFADIITKPEDKRVYHGSGANYINALANATNCAPVIPVSYTHLTLPTKA